MTNEELIQQFTSLLTKAEEKVWVDCPDSMADMKKSIAELQEKVEKLQKVVDVLNVKEVFNYTCVNTKAELFKRNLKVFQDKEGFIEFNAYFTESSNNSEICIDNHKIKIYNPIRGIHGRFKLLIPYNNKKLLKTAADSNGNVLTISKGLEGVIVSFDSANTITIPCEKLTCDYQLIYNNNNFSDLFNTMYVDVDDEEYGE